MMKNQDYTTSNNEDTSLNKDLGFYIESLDLQALDELLDKEYPSTEWIIDSLIPEQTVVLLSAQPANPKTWFTLGLGPKIAARKNIVGCLHALEAEPISKTQDLGEM